MCGIGLDNFEIGGLDVVGVRDAGEDREEKKEEDGKEGSLHGVGPPAGAMVGTVEAGGVSTVT